MPVRDLQPPKRQSTVEYVADEQREAISAGRLHQGEQLGEHELAQRLDVSRGPLREAMQRLVAEGLLHAIRNRGVFVTELSLADVRDIYHTRAVIERASLELVLPDAAESTAEALQPSVAAMRTAARHGRASAVSDADQHFHEALVEASASPRLLRAMRTLVVESRMCLGELETNYADLGVQVREHSELLWAIRDGSLPQAQELLNEHMADAVQRVVAKRVPPAS